MNLNFLSSDDTSFAKKYLGASFLLSGLLFIILSGIGILSPEMRADVKHIWLFDLWTACASFILVLMVLKALQKGQLGPCTLALFVVGIYSLVMLNNAAQWHADFGCYYEAGKKMLRGDNIYLKADGAAGAGGYMYSPVVANVITLFMQVVGEKSGGIFFNLWTITNFWASMLFTWLLIITLLRVYKWPIITAAICTGVALIISVPLFETLQQGQINIFVGCLLVGFIYLWQKHPLISSGLLAGAILLKISPALLLILPLINRRWLAFCFAIVFCIVGAGLSIIHTGTQPWVDFYHALPYMQNNQFCNSSIASMVSNFFKVFTFSAPNSIQTIITVILQIILVGWILNIGHRVKWQFPWRNEYPVASVENLAPIALFIMLAMSPIVWAHHHLWVMLPALLLLRACYNSPWFYYAATGAALMFLIPTFSLYPLGFHRLPGLIMLWWAFDKVLRSPGNIKPS